MITPKAPGIRRGRPAPTCAPVSCEKHATVVNVHASHVEVAVESAACAGCNGRCLGFTATEKSLSISRSLFDQSGDIRRGDVIKLSLPGTTLISLSSLVYLLPVMLMLLFAIACDSLLESSDLVTATAALIGLGSGLVICRMMAVRFSQSIRSQISVTANG